MVKRAKQSPNASLYQRISDLPHALSLVDSLVLVQEEPPVNEAGVPVLSKTLPWRVGVLRCVSAERWRRVFVHLAAKIVGFTAFDHLPDPSKVRFAGSNDIDELKWSKNQIDRLWVEPGRADVFLVPSSDIRIPRGQTAAAAPVTVAASGPVAPQVSSEDGATETSTPELQAVRTHCEAWSSCGECGYLVEANSAEYQVIRCGVCKGEFHSDCLLPFEKLKAPSQTHLKTGISSEAEGEEAAVWECPLCRRCSCCDVPLAAPLAQTSALRQTEPVLICQGCNLAVHGCCYFPRVPRLQSGTQWRCDECRQCQSCEFETTLDARTGEVDVGTWAYSYKQCQRCFQGQEKGEYCAVCLKAWSVNWGDELMVQCDNCQFWIHSKCDLVETERIKSLAEAVKDIRYHCPLCRDVSEKSRILRVVDMLKAHDKQRHFTDPVHPQFLPIYQRVIKQPMFLNLMKEKVLKNEYLDLQDFVNDFAIIINNARTFNMPNTPPYRAAEIFEKTGNNLIKKFIRLRNATDGERKEKRARVVKKADTSSEQAGTADDAEEAVRALLGLESDAFLRSPWKLLPISACGSLLSFLVPATSRDEAASEWRASEWVLRDVCAGCGGYEAVAGQSPSLQGCRVCGECFHRGCAGLASFPGEDFGDFVCAACTRCRFCRVYYVDECGAAGGPVGWVSCEGCGEAWHGRCKPKNMPDYVLLDATADGEEVRRALCERCVTRQSEKRLTKQQCAGCHVHGGSSQSWVSCVLCGKLSHSRCHRDWKSDQTASPACDMWSFDVCKECTEFTLKEFPQVQQGSSAKLTEFVKKLHGAATALHEGVTLSRLVRALGDDSPRVDAAKAFTMALYQHKSLAELVPKVEEFFDDEEETNFVALCLENREQLFQGLLRTMDETSLVKGLRLFWRVSEGEDLVSNDLSCGEFQSTSAEELSAISPGAVWSFWRDAGAAGRFWSLAFTKMRAARSSAALANSWPERRCLLCGWGSEDELFTGPLLPLGARRWVHAECVKWSVSLETSDVGEHPLSLLVAQAVYISRSSAGSWSQPSRLLVPEWREEVEKVVAESAEVTCTFCGQVGASLASECGEVLTHFPCLLLNCRSAGLELDVVHRQFAKKLDSAEAEAAASSTRRVCSIREKLRRVQEQSPLTLAKPLALEEEGERFAAVPEGAGLRSGALTVLSLGEWPGFTGQTFVLPRNYAAVRVFWSFGRAGSRKRQAYLCRVGAETGANQQTCSVQLMSETGAVGQVVGLGRNPEEAWQQVKRSHLAEHGASVADLSGNWFFGLEAPVVAKKLKRRALGEFRDLARDKKPLWLREFAFRSVILRTLGAAIDKAKVDTLQSWRSHWSDSATALNVPLEHLGLVEEFQGERSDLLAEDAVLAMGEWQSCVGSPPTLPGGGQQTRLKASALSRALEGLPLSTQFRVRSSVPDGELLAVRSSEIHSNGLFARQNFRKGEMVVEYLGDLIRHSVSDLREKKAIEDQEGADGSCYMFRLDDEFVVDATVRGNCARFINHSCQPNCICKVVECDERRRHIVIIAKHDILKNEEITYDYQFAVESEKLTCTCGAPNCLGRLN